jgi:predicted RNA-binding Zn-ribbon protein involved in translation (DUF1610 family)
VVSKSAKKVVHNNEHKRVNETGRMNPVCVNRKNTKESIMVIEKKDLSTAESLRKTRTYGKFRCHNPSCMERIEPEKGSKTAKCPTCGMEYRVHWVNPNLPRIRGPVWEVNKKLAEAKLKEKGVT